MKNSLLIFKAALLLVAASSAVAQEFPKPGKPIRVVVGWAPGGPTDSQARVISQELGAQLGVTVIVENKPGASGLIGAQDVARAEADGHTLLYTVDGSMTQTPHMQKNLPVDPFKNFTPVARTVAGGVALVTSTTLPVNNAQELIAYARKNPGKLSFASFGTGTVSHIYGEVLKQNAGLDIEHIPYKGSAEALKDLIAGRVQIMFDSPALALQHAKDGKLKILGTAGEKRRAMLPEVPTLLEQGLKGFEQRSWNAYFGPANMPPAVLLKLNAAITKATNSPEVTKKLNSMGFEPLSETAPDFAKVLKSDHERWGEYIKRANISPQ
ncbi:MAG: Tripartite-type tricarboxylate transporter, receptor component TctC [Burkholderia sp.]|nr:Tripartite-type tricarboxylate transporter, receptor component TctC [Burkholderia sp.]